MVTCLRRLTHHAQRLLYRSSQPVKVPALFTLWYVGMPLSDSQKRFLRTRGHALKPIVIVGGDGLGKGVLKEIDSSLEHHELMKVRVNAADREEREQLITTLCDRAHCELVQRIGHIALLYRAAKEPHLVLPR